jgi:hypothetical protein
MQISLRYGDHEWNYWNQTCVPAKGEIIWIDRAPAGHVYIVVGVQHRFLSGEHSVVVMLDLLPETSS